MSQQYIVITLEDAAALARAIGPASAEEAEAVRRFRERMARETGADMQEIVDRLTKDGLCAACIIEGQESSCRVLRSQKLGRRLRRLLERARGERS